MNQKTRRRMAALLVTAVLAVPGGAFAATDAPAPLNLPLSSPALPMPGKEAVTDLLAAPKVTRAEAIATAKRTFTIPAELGEPNVSINQGREGTVWALEWTSSSKQPDRLQISVGINGETGGIVHYSTWSSKQAESLQLSVTRGEAQTKAEGWLEKLVSAEQRQDLRLKPGPLNASYWGGATYQFRWTREVAGYPFADSGVNITIDARSGDLVSYDFHWPQQVKMTLPEQVLSREEAVAAYRKQLPMVLQYQRFQKRGTEEFEWRLVYRPLGDGFHGMDQAGKLVDYRGEPLDLQRLSAFKLVPASERPYQKPAQPLTQEQALAIARAITGQTAAPNNSNYRESGEETKQLSWSFNWEFDGAEGGRKGGSSVSIDAATGLVTDYYFYTETKPFEKGEKAPVSLEQAQEKAIAFIRANRPDLAGSLRLVPDRSVRPMPKGEEFQPTEYYVAFQRMQNGIPVVGREVQLSVDARTGAVRSFWGMNLDEGAPAEFPSAKPGITPEQAMNAFMAEQGIEATWVIYRDSEKGRESDPVLLWRPSDRLEIQSIDAQTGVPLDWDGRNLIEAQRSPSDIKGHYAEREIELLWARGVFDLQDGKFNPDQAVSADELTRWIVLSRGMRPYVAYDFALAGGRGGAAMEQAKSSANSAYFGAALQSGIILPEELALLKDLNGPVPRELFALWSARAMGYGRIAKMESRIEMAFADKGQIGAPYQNAVAIMAGLGILSGDGQAQFNPQRPLTRADAAKILFAVSSN